MRRRDRLLQDRRRLRRRAIQGSWLELIGVVYDGLHAVDVPAIADFVINSTAPMLSLFSIPCSRRQNADAWSLDIENSIYCGSSWGRTLACGGLTGRLALDHA